MRGDVVNAMFESADNIVFELDGGKTKDAHNFGKKVHICAVSVSHGNDDYVIVSLRKPDDTQPFWKNKFYKGLNGQIFIQPIPKLPITQIIVEVEPKEGAQINDSVLVNISYI